MVIIFCCNKNSTVISVFGFQWVWGLYTSFLQSDSSSSRNKIHIEVLISELTLNIMVYFKMHGQNKLYNLFLNFSNRNKEFQQMCCGSNTTFLYLFVFSKEQLFLGVCNDFLQKRTAKNQTS